MYHCTKLVPLVNFKKKIGGGGGLMAFSRTTYRNRSTFILIFPVLPHHNMEAIFSIPFTVLEVPNLKLKRPGWVKQPSAMVMFSMVLFSYFLVTGGKALENTSA